MKVVDSYMLRLMQLEDENRAAEASAPAWALKARKWSFKDPLAERRASKQEPEEENESCEGPSQDEHEAHQQRVGGG